MTQQLLFSQDIFEQVCDLLSIPECDRNILSLDLHLEIDELVTYECRKYAPVKDD